MQIWSGVAGQRDQVVERENPGLGDPAPHLGQHDPVRAGLIALVAPGILDRLERDAPHAAPLQREAHDVGDVRVVHALLHRDDQRGRDTRPLERLERLDPDAREVGAADVHQRRRVERVELQVDLETRHELGEPFREPGLACDADAVGVDHQMADRPALGRGQDVEEVRVKGGLAARELHEVRLAFRADERVQHGFDHGQRAVRRPFDRAVRVTDRAGQVADIRHLDDGEARMLLRGPGIARNHRGSRDRSASAS